MSKENSEIVRRSIGAYVSGDMQAALAAYDVEAEFDVSSVRPEGGVYRGHEGIEEVILAWVETWVDYRFEVEVIIDKGDRVLVIMQEYGRGDGSGIEIEQHVFWVNTMRDGKIVHTKLFLDRAEALDAAGLSE
ncbi:MAG: nuclear transport factor 2 family protein [Solirubrobacterales bacterium]